MRMPASMALVPLTTWKRWGMEMIAAMKGKPVRNAFLCSVNGLFVWSRQRKKVNTHNNNPKTNLSHANLHGNNGSQTPPLPCSFFLWPFIETYLSQTTNTTHNTPDKTNAAITGALSHGYATPACSNANTSRTDAAREDTAPR